jgi:hypothetical protein
MRWLFCLLYLGCLAALPLELRRRESARIKQTSEFLSLMQRIRREIACYARPLSEICRAADLPELQKAGFFDALESGDPHAAFRRASLCLPADAFALLDGFFAGAGAPKKEEELAACDRVIAELDGIVAREKREVAARLRLRSTLILTGGLLFLLLVI